jgi:hypothetical protein
VDSRVVTGTALAATVRMRQRWFRALTLCSSLGLLATSCFVETDPGPLPPIPVARAFGTLTVDWTINGSKDPDQCNQSFATTLDAMVHTTSGKFVGEFQEACRSFATSIDLPRGSYTADAVLIDANGFDRTTAVRIDTFAIRGNDNLSVPIDFPARSFRSP